MPWKANYKAEVVPIDDGVMRHCMTSTHRVEGFDFPIVGCGNDDFVQRIITMCHDMFIQDPKEPHIQRVINATKLSTSYAYTSRMGAYMVRTAARQGVSEEMLKEVAVFAGGIHLFQNNKSNHIFDINKLYARVILWYQAYTYFLEHPLLELL